MERKDISMEEVVGKINDAFEKMNQKRVDGLKETQTVQQVKNEARLREHERLKNKYGKNHPRVQKIEAQLSYYELTSEALDLETERAGIEIPEFEADSWRIHGRVLNQERKGMQGLTIFLRDEKDKRVEAMGHACTDERGYFALTYTRPDDEDNDKRQLPKIFLTVSDKDKNIIHREKEALTVVIGQIDYREIVLGEDQCETPPSDNTDDAGNGDEPEARWGVKGTVVSAGTGKGIRELTVRLQDKEELITEKRGTTKTDAEGAFSFMFTKKDSPELFKKTPEVQLQVMDRSGNLLHTGEKPLKVEPGKVKQVTVKIEQQKTWRVKGTVTYPDSDRGHRGYTVSLSDKEGQFTQKLGSTETQARGAFELTYTSDDIPELFNKKPALFLTVRDKEGNEVFTSDKPVKVEEGKEEKIKVEVK